MTEDTWLQERYSIPFFDKLSENTDGEYAGFALYQLLEHAVLPADAAILDTSSGKGTLSRLLASKGYHVTGVDASAQAIDQAIAEGNDNPEFFLHDLRLPLRGNYFDLAFLTSGFGYYRTRREHEAALRTVVTSLRAGGQLIIDYPNTYYRQIHHPAQHEREIGTARFSFGHWEDALSFYTKVIITDPSLEDPYEYITRQAKFSLQDLTGMLNHQGMTITEVAGDYRFTPYSESAERLIIFAKKQDAEQEDREKRIYSDGRKTDPLT